MSDSTIQWANELMSTALLTPLYLAGAAIISERDVHLMADFMRRMRDYAETTGMALSMPDFTRRDSRGTYAWDALNIASFVRVNKKIIKRIPDFAPTIRVLTALDNYIEESKRESDNQRPHGADTSTERWWQLRMELADILPPTVTRG